MDLAEGFRQINGEAPKARHPEQWSRSRIPSNG
jgi:hypothetical protein